MKPGERNRLAVVRDLLELSRPLDEIAAQLAMMEWDYEGDGVEFTVRHLIAVLHRYLRDELSVSDIESWANSIEGRDDVYFETGREQETKEVLYELANPGLTQPLDRSRARAILEGFPVPGKDQA